MSQPAVGKLRAQQTDISLILEADHSQVEFPLWKAGFKLRRRGQVILYSGPGWGEPCSNLTVWSVDDDTAVISYNRGTHGIGRLIVHALDNGWRFEWDQPTRDTFDLGSGGHWYGQGELIHQHHPLETASLWEAPLITWDNGPTGLGDIQEPSWITSSGAVIVMDNPTHHLTVGLNAPPASVTAPVWDLTSGQAPASHRPPPTMPGSSGLLTLLEKRAPLSYRLLVGADPVDAHTQLIKVVGKPNAHPPENLLREPIWTTWARYKTAITQDTVLNFAQEIRDYGFPGSTLEIDDKWQVYYGDTFFDSTRFPDPAGMVDQLADLGFATTAWVIPFLEPASKSAHEAVLNNYVVRRLDGKPYDVPWWQGTAYLLDVSNPYALDWWRDRLKNLKERVGLAGYKFDAGEGNYLPPDAQLHQPINRSEYSTRWVQFAAQNFPYCEVRCGWRSQRQPVLFRQWDKFSVWGLDNGLASIITTGLALGMAGYPFILPDMIGGNAYGDVLADKELVIRWAQASAPMLAIQFSLAPWDYDEETVAICRHYAQLHVTLYPERLTAAQQAVKTGAPVIRPMFWASPRDPVAQVVRDQYMLGDRHLVAPVVTPNTAQRDIYLPEGGWLDYWDGTFYDGGRWLRGYPAPLEMLPLFVREE